MGTQAEDTHPVVPATFYCCKDSPEMRHTNRVMHSVVGPSPSNDVKALLQANDFEAALKKILAEPVSSWMF